MRILIIYPQVSPLYSFPKYHPFLLFLSITSLPASTSWSARSGGADDDEGSDGREEGEQAVRNSPGGNREPPCFVSNFTVVWVFFSSFVSSFADF